MNNQPIPQAELEKAIETFEGELAECTSSNTCILVDIPVATTLLQAAKQLSALEAKCAEMCEALMPFKQMADKFDVPDYRDQWPDKTCIHTNEVLLSHCYLTLGDFRKAKNAISSTCGQNYIHKDKVEIMIGQMNNRLVQLQTPLKLIANSGTSCDGTPSVCSCAKHVAQRALAKAEGVIE